MTNDDLEELIRQTDAEDRQATLDALNDIAEKKFREILPSEGVWMVEDLAIYLGLPPTTVQQRLSDLGIGVITFSSRYKHKLVRLEDLKKEDRSPLQEG